MISRMARFFRRARAYVDYATRIQPLFEDEPTWTNADAEAYERFLRSSQGRKILTMLENAKARTIVWALERDDATQYGRGYASGFGAAVKAFFVFSAPVLPQSTVDSGNRIEFGGEDQPSEDAQPEGMGEPELREHLRP